MKLKDIFKLVFNWRILTILISLPAIFFLTPRDGFVSFTGNNLGNTLISMWSNFDGADYLRIAESGYGFEHRLEADFRFFPLYPLLIRFFSVSGHFLATSLFLSHFFLILGLFFLYRLALLDFKPKVARSSLLLLLFFPTAFFFGSAYPDSLLFFLIVFTFFLSRKRQFFLAGVTAALASATGLSGLFLWPVLIYEYWLARGQSLKDCFHLESLSLVLPPLGLFFFLRFQQVFSGLTFWPTLLSSGLNGQTVEKLILLHQIFFRYSKMIIFTDHLDPLFFTIVLELCTAIIILLILIFSIKKLRFSYWFFILFSYLFASLGGSFMSLPRSTLALFPIFIFLADWLERHHPFWRLAYLSLCLIGTVFSIIFFTRGYFIG